MEARHLAPPHSRAQSRRILTSGRSRHGRRRARCSPGRKAPAPVSTSHARIGTAIVALRSGMTRGSTTAALFLALRSGRRRQSRSSSVSSPPHPGNVVIEGVFQGSIPGSDESARTRAGCLRLARRIIPIPTFWCKNLQNIDGPPVYLLHTRLWPPGRRLQKLAGSLDQRARGESVPEVGRALPSPTRSGWSTYSSAKNTTPVASEAQSLIRSPAEHGSFKRSRY